MGPMSLTITLIMHWYMCIVNICIHLFVTRMLCQLCKRYETPLSAPGLLCAWHMTQACALAHASHLSPPQVDCPLSSNPDQDWPPFKGAGPHNSLSTILTSALVDGWVLDSIACLVNKGLVVHTLVFCILCLAAPGHRHFTG